MDIWAQLQAPFPLHALEWRIVHLSGDRLHAKLRPQLRCSALIERLDQVVGVACWSNHFSALGDGATSCTLTIRSVSKSVAVPLACADPRVDAATRSEDALIYAAERFNILPLSDLNADYWVDFDPEGNQLLFDPEPVVRAPAQPNHPARDLPNQPLSQEDKSPGQQTIDRLVERLKLEGLGLEAAKLLVRYGGYGQNSEQARALYRDLRALLLQREASGQPV